MDRKKQKLYYFNFVTLFAQDEVEAIGIVAVNKTFAVFIYSALISVYKSKCRAQGLLFGIFGKCWN